MLHFFNRYNGADFYSGCAYFIPYSIYQPRNKMGKKLGDFITKPIESLKETYNWDSGDIAFNKLIRNLNRFGHSVRFHSGDYQSCSCYTQNI